MYREIERMTKNLRANSVEDYLYKFDLFENRQLQVWELESILDMDRRDFEYVLVPDYGYDKDTDEVDLNTLLQKLQVLTEDGDLDKVSQYQDRLKKMTDDERAMLKTVCRAVLRKSKPAKNESAYKVFFKQNSKRGSLWMDEGLLKRIVGEILKDAGYNERTSAKEDVIYRYLQLGDQNDDLHCINFVNGLSNVVPDVQEIRDQELAKTWYEYKPQMGQTIKKNLQTLKVQT